MSNPRSVDDVPPNPREKAGYRLEFHDEFDGPDLDTQKWLPMYLPQWSSRARSAPNYVVAHDTLILQITADQQAWCPEFDGQTRCSSMQTGVFAGPVGSRVGQHRFNPACIVREQQTNCRTYTPQYSYVEIHAQAVNTPMNLVSLWMIGYEESPEQSAEIAVMEIRGQHVHANQARVGYGVHPWYDPTIVDEFYEDVLPIDATCYHIYAIEWTPTHIDVYVDNHKLRTIHQSPAYPMQLMLGIYELPDTGDALILPARSPAYPKQFVIDYVRVYQPLEGYPPP